MKMTPEHYDTIAIKIERFVREHKTSTTDVTRHYLQNGRSKQRARWDLFHAAVNDMTSELYAYLNDNHIDTALRRICHHKE